MLIVLPLHVTWSKDRLLSNICHLTHRDVGNPSESSNKFCSCSMKTRVLFDMRPRVRKRRFFEVSTLGRNSARIRLLSALGYRTNPKRVSGASLGFLACLAFFLFFKSPQTQNVTIVCTSISGLGSSEDQIGNNQCRFFLFTGTFQEALLAFLFSFTFRFKPIWNTPLSPAYKFATPNDFCQKMKFRAPTMSQSRSRYRHETSKFFGTVRQS